MPHRGRHQCSSDAGVVHVPDGVTVLTWNCLCNGGCRDMRK
jgi:hypothetical protein